MIKTGGTASVWRAHRFTEQGFASTGSVAMSEAAHARKIGVPNFRAGGGF